MGREKEVLIYTKIPESELNEYKYAKIPIYPQPFPGGMSPRIWEYMEKVLHRHSEKGEELLKKASIWDPIDPRGGRRFFHMHIQEAIIPVDRVLFKEVFLKAADMIMTDLLEEGIDYGGFLDNISAVAIDTVPLPE
jgi:hypothetical protein